MFRPLRLLGRNAVKIVTINSHRSKIIFPESFLDKAERMKLWHSENKQLFGSIIREKKANQKDKRKKASKSPKELTLNDVSISTHVRISQMSQKISKNDMNTKEKQNIGSDKNMFIDSAMKKMNLSDSSVTNNAKYAAMRPDKKHQIEIISPNVKNGILSASNHTVPSVIIRNLRLFPMMNNQKAYVADSNSDDATEEKILQVRSSKVEHQKFPSVSKILDQTMSPESRAALEKWKKEKIEELGLAEFEKFYRAQLDAGSRFHGLLSKHLLSPQDYVSADTDIQGVWTSVGPVLKNIKNPKAVESHVVHPVLKYKGIIDCVAVYQDKPTLIEWKKSDKPKQTLSATYDNPVQLAAYFGAISHDPNYKGLNVRDALLVIAYTDGSPADTFHLSMDQMRQHWAAWLTRLEKFVAAEKETEAAKTIEDSNDKSVS